MNPRAFTCGDTMLVHAADAWSIARFCALVAEEADDDAMYRSLLNLRDVWIDIANECELLAGRVDVVQREPIGASVARARALAL